jgi:hypothetical protein
MESMRPELGLVELAVVVEPALDSVRPAALAKGIRVETFHAYMLKPVEAPALACAVARLAGRPAR